MKYKELFSSTKTTLILGITLVIVAFIYFIVDDQPSKMLFGADNPKAKGELVALYLTAIGGSAVIYGLYLNNKRIQEQTRQNDIEERASIDNRFGDAIGYLNSENVGIATGGAYALYQLAKENSSYISIICNLFVNYINSKTSRNNIGNEENKVQSDIQIIIDLLYDNNGIFSSLEKRFSRANLYYIEFKNQIYNTYFDLCQLTNCHFKGQIIDSSFWTTSLQCCYFKNTIKNVKFGFIRLEHCIFSNENDIIFKECHFLKISNSRVSIKGKYIEGFLIYNDDKNNVFSFEVENIINLKINADKNNVFRFNNCNFISAEFDSNIVPEYMNCINIANIITPKPNVS